jgi:hypothetical protein
MLSASEGSKQASLGCTGFSRNCSKNGEAGESSKQAATPSSQREIGVRACAASPMQMIHGHLL